MITRRELDMPIPFIILGATIAMGVSGVGIGARSDADLFKGRK